MPVPHIPILPGERFGRLTILQRVENIGRKTNIPAYECRCDCGKIKVAASCDLRNGNVGSCGCLGRDSRRRGLKEDEAARNRVYGSYRGHARRRHIYFGLTVEQFDHLTQQNCHYCGAEPSNFQESKHGRDGFAYNGIDRIDNGLGYILSNVVPCCAICNEMKMDRSTVDFLNQCRKIVEFQKELN